MTAQLPLRAFVVAGLSVFAVALVLFIGKATTEVMHSSKVDSCAMTPPGSKYIHAYIGAKWRWWPPGYVCTYSRHP